MLGILGAAAPLVKTLFKTIDKTIDNKADAETKYFFLAIIGMHLVIKIYSEYLGSVLSHVATIS